jgi:hypothetical protein
MVRRRAAFLAPLSTYAVAGVFYCACGGGPPSDSRWGVEAGANEPDANAEGNAPPPGGQDAAPGQDAGSEETPPADAGASPLDSAPDPGQPPPPTLGACDHLAAVGTYEDVTPPMAIVDGAPTTFAIAADPHHLGTFFVGTTYNGLWKTQDCGATWAEVATGTNGAAVNSGMNWTIAVDPIVADVVYTNSGYGMDTNGLYKSTNGGIDWDRIWPPASQPDLGMAFMYNFANVVALDPSNHLHLLLTFHETCLPPHPSTCIAESMDGGGTWRLLDGQPGWVGTEGQVIFFLNDSATWLWGSQDSGFWVGTGSGSSWTAVPKMTTSHLQSSQLARTATGAFLMATADGLSRSPDGAASSWQAIANTGPIGGGLIDVDGTIYFNNCYFPQFCTNAKYETSTDDGMTFSAIAGPPVSEGGPFAYDPGHAVLLSSSGAGVWRTRLK